MNLSAYQIQLIVDVLVEKRKSLQNRLEKGAGLRGKTVSDVEFLIDKISRVIKYLQFHLSQQVNREFSDDTNIQ